MGRDNNLKFEVDDVEDKWVYAHKFDFIHGRLTREMGAWFRRDMEVGVEGILMGLFTRVLRMGRDEVGILVEELNREIRDDGLLAFQPL
ncbi:hypothetical protein HYFRA_00007421 [Hymenoscyphus fraxineus]|uniref:Uncharacterized protein n=1 Tax=Hymenoscyphus fraxineus TaxID=746836 RepID=A0A9N9KP88_9HELO|nr:hypothetical protein HYFRA_00007421 [Hymenoscyphus fraxineus]